MRTAWSIKKSHCLFGAKQEKRVCKCGAVLDKKYEKAAKKKAAPKSKKSADESKTSEAKAKKTKLEKAEKTTKASTTKNKAETANVKRKQDM